MSSRSRVGQSSIVTEKETCRVRHLQKHTYTHQLLTAWQLDEQHWRERSGQQVEGDVE